VVVFHSTAVDDSFFTQKLSSARICWRRAVLVGEGG